MCVSGCGGVVDFHTVFPFVIGTVEPKLVYIIPIPLVTVHILCIYMYEYIHY